MQTLKAKVVHTSYKKWTLASGLKSQFSFHLLVTCPVVLTDQRELKS